MILAFLAFLAGIVAILMAAAVIALNIRSSRRPLTHEEAQELAQDRDAW